MRAMKRRHFFRQAAGLALLPLAGTLLGGCEKDPNSGPVDVKWDRQVCERCSMILSDTRYAAQIRDPQGTVHYYDDFGCAIFDLRKQGWDEAKIEFWVTDYKTGRWTSAYKARYVPERTTPMGYGLGATTVPNPKDMGYADAKAAILIRDK
ncbi:MAG: protein NosL [Rhodocyclaceae bacterium]|nr:protein NosL [Rhodocyclaceae bacterium]